MTVRVERATSLAKIDENSHVGLHIRKRRLELNLSQGQVGKYIGVVDEAVTGWELGYYLPKIRYVPKIIEFLGYNPYPKQETKTFGGKVKLYRLLHNLSHRKMAKVLHADPGTVAHWESNATTPIEPRLSELMALLQLKTNIAKTSSEADIGSAGAQPMKE
jgi:transcriptional regulator with XRE-family HTH domain